MDSIREGMEFNGRVWKEPRGFIKILELIFGICAFATTSSYSSVVGIFYPVDTKQTIKSEEKLYKFSYPFDLEDVKVSVTNNTSTFLGGSYASSAEFFVAIGVLTFLYCLAALLIYIFLDKLYRSREKAPLVDFIITVIFAFLWLVCSSAWAHGLTGVKNTTDPTNLSERLQKYTDASGGAGCADCRPGTAPNYANLNISVIFGFLNFFIWCGNVWFLFKETPWYTGNPPVVVQSTVTTSGPGMAPPAKI